MDSYIIREISGEEIEESAKVIRESFRTVADDFNFTYENNPMHGAFLQSERLKNEKQKGIEMYGLFVEKKLVGFVALEKFNDGMYEMQKLGVLPSYRHLGYGEALVDFVKQRALIQGGDKIDIGVIEHNNILKYWYEKIGFKKVGIKQFKHLPFNVEVMRFIVK